MGSVAEGGPGTACDDEGLRAFYQDHAHIGSRGRPNRFDFIEVALDGTVNAETVRGRRVSGPGGQPDFAAAAVIHGGLNVIALPSTVARGRVSRIVKRLPPGAAVTTPPCFADIVVTEHGAAQLRGRTLDQRASALRAIAHSDFESDLRN